MTSPADFANFIAGSHRLVSVCRAVDTYQSTSDPTGTDLDLIAGTVTLDATAAIMGSGSVTLAAPFPTVRDLALAPFGAELFLARGVGAAAIPLLAPLGYYRVDNVSQAPNSQGLLTISLLDRMSTVIDSRLVVPAVFARTTTVEEALDVLVRDIYPDVIYNDLAGVMSETLGRQVLVEENRGAGLRDIGNAKGVTVYFDGLGRLTLDPGPDADTPPVWRVHAGTGGVQIATGRELSRDRVYNGVVVTGEGTDDEDPIRVIATDSGSASPMRWDGPFGKIPRFYTSQMITTVDQAERTARALLRRHAGARRNMNFTAIPNPALRPVHVVQIRTSNGSLSNHIMDTVTIGLAATDVLTATGREETVLLVEVLT